MDEIPVKKVEKTVLKTTPKDDIEEEIENQEEIVEKEIEEKEIEEKE